MAFGEVGGCDGDGGRIGSGADFWVGAESGGVVDWGGMGGGLSAGGRDYWDARKVSTNEFIAFLQLKDMTPQAHAAATQAATASAPAVVPVLGYLSQRASILATYAICDFANFVSIGIQIGGFTPICLERKRDFAADRV